VDKNDVLYFEDSFYEEELTEIIAIVVDMLVTCLDEDNDKVQFFIQIIYFLRQLLVLSIVTP